MLGDHGHTTTSTTSTASATTRAAAMVMVTYPLPPRPDADGVLARVGGPTDHTPVLTGAGYAAREAT